MTTIVHNVLKAFLVVAGGAVLAANLHAQGRGAAPGA